MKCEEAGELFSEYICGDMEGALSVSLEHHLSGCIDCRQAVADVSRRFGVLSMRWRLLNPLRSSTKT